MALPPHVVAEYNNVRKLQAILDEQDKQPNVLTLEEFRHFRPLYNVPAAQDRTRLDQKYSKLMGEFVQRIDLYKPIVVVRSVANPQVILRLPQILVPLQTMRGTPENDKAVDINNMHSGSDIPSVWSSAQSNMVRALIKDQATPDQIKHIAATRRETNVLLAEFDRLYQRETMKGAATQEETSGLTAADFED